MFWFNFDVYFKYAWSPQIRNSLIIIGILIIFTIIFGHYLGKKDPNAKPSKIQLIFEEIVKLINTLCKLTIGKRWRGYAPYFLAIVIYLLVANTAGIWAIDAPTSSWNVTLGLGLITFFMVHYTGLRSLGIKKYLKSYTDPLPPYIPFLAPENVLTAFMLPFSLSLRLFGNIMSGAVMSILIYGLISPQPWGWAALIIMPFFHMIFDLFFGAIQAVVFTLLSCVFIGQKVDEEELIVE